MTAVRALTVAGAIFKHITEGKGILKPTVDLDIKISLALADAALIRTILKAVVEDDLQVFLRVGFKLSFSDIN